MRDHRHIQALYPNDTKKWSTEWTAGFSANLALDLQNGVLYGFDCGLIAINLVAFDLETGGNKWYYTFPFVNTWGTPLIHPDGYVVAYFGMTSDTGNNSAIAVHALYVIHSCIELHSDVCR